MLTFTAALSRFAVRLLLIIGGVGLLAVGLTACGAAPTFTPASAPAGSTASATRALTLVPPKDLTPTLTFTDTPETQAAATLRAAKTAVVQTVVAAGQPEIYSSFPAPDGNWTAQFSRFGCTAVTGYSIDLHSVEQLELIDRQAGTKRLVTSELINCGGIGAFGLGGLFWSPNSRYFYYTPAQEGQPDGGCGYWEPDVNRVEVNTGVTEVLGGGSRSPDGTKLAVWNFWRESQLVLWDIDGEEIGRLQPYYPDKGPGAITWSPDGQALVYFQTKDDCSPGATLLVRVDLPALSQTLIPNPEEINFVSALWEKQTELHLIDDQDREWRYDFTTRTLEKTSQGTE